jgi:non-ribosomal peptide synthetase component F/alpha-ketoglutarate-dependent taurine dioxygenase
MTAKNVAAIYPLSPQQQGMLFDTLQLSAPGVHIEQKIYVLRGELDVRALERAWQHLVERHSILRTAFVWKNQDEPLQCVLREVELKISKHDWRALPEAEQRERLQSFIEEDRRRGFELTRPPLLRLTLFQMADETYQLVWTHHHIVLDGWCRPIIDEELRTLYETLRKGDVPDLPPARPYRDYIAWLKRQNLASAESFWHGVLDGIRQPTPLGIETSASHEFAETGFGELRIKLSDTSAASLKQLARQHHVTLNTFVQGLWAIMLSRYSGSNDVIFGTTVSGRPMDLDGAATMLGLFINTLPFRVTMRRGPFWSWLSELQQHHLEMRQYEFCSSGQIHQWCKFPGLLPLYESILVFENYPADGGANRPQSILSEAQTYTFGAQTRYPINVLVVTRTGLDLVVIFDRSRFVESTVPILRDHFLALCDAIVADPEQDLTALGQQIEGAPRLRTRVESERDYEAPRTTCEERLAGIWAEVLGVARVGRHDDFFALKGHSLLATQVLSRIRDAFDVQLPLRSLFEAPTIAALAERIELARGETASDGPALVRVPRDRPLPLSFAQQRLWFLSQLEPESPSYNIPSAIRLSGVLDVNALEQALNALVARHETLRTVFQVVDDEPVQVVLAEQSCKLEIADVTHLSPAERETDAIRLIAAAAARPFDLGSEPSFRALLVKLGEQDHILLLNVHHIVSDGWSMAILFRELGLLYQKYVGASVAPLPGLSIQYADYAVWQRDGVQGKRLEELLSYWKNHLAGAPAVLELPLDRPRPRVQGSQGEKVSFMLSPELSDCLQSTSRREGVTVFMTLLAAFQVLLARLTQRDDVMVGTDLANRTRVETEGLIGFFVNLLPVRTRLLNNPTFSEVLQQVREVLLEAYARQELPFEKLVEELKPPRDLSRNPLVQVLFVMQNTPRPVFELPGVKVDWLEPGTETSRFDVVLFVAEIEGRIKATWLYNADLFERATIERMSTQFERLLDQVVGDPLIRVGSLSIEVMTEENERAAPRPVRRTRRKAVNLGQLSQVKTRLLFDHQTLPLLIEPERVDVDLAEWATTNDEFVSTNLLTHGALLFRGFDVPSVPDFERFAQTLCPALYGEYGDLPREEMGGKVYGSTPYPADETILFHNESSHLHRWPMLIWFYCVKPSEVGGETPIADCRRIYEAIDPDLRRRFAERGLMYVRNFTPGLDVSWQQFFHTGEPTAVEDYCRQAGINFEWRRDGGLRTRQICPAIVKHPQTGEMVFFNQLQLHHVSCLAPAVRESLLSMMPEEDFPRNVYYGDGTRIEDSVMDQLLSVYRQCAVTFAWQQHDIIMLNNMLVAHSRNPYVGERKIVVALGNLFSSHKEAQKAQE